MLAGLNTPLVDTSDLSFQVDPAFKPVNEPLWESTLENDGWTIAHNALRGEMTAMSKVLDHLQGKPLLEWQVQALCDWIAGHSQHILAHHSNEDDLFAPFFSTRFKYPEKLESDHHALLENLKKVEAQGAALAAGGTVHALRAAFAKHVGEMVPHLYEEERVGLPLCRAYFTPKEVGVVVEQVIKKSDPLELGAIWYFLGSKEEVLAFMAREHIPWFVWYLVFKGQRANYEKKMAARIDALLSDTPPIVTPNSVCQRLSASFC